MCVSGGRRQWWIQTDLQGGCSESVYLSAISEVSRSVIGGKSAAVKVLHLSAVMLAHLSSSTQLTGLHTDEISRHNVRVR